MPVKDHTEIICVLDRSGSMQSVKSDTIGGFNSFIENQKKEPGTASVTLVLFDDKYEVPYTNCSIDKVEPLNEKTFVPRGNTALFDATGRAINETGERLAKTAEHQRPEKVMIVILTDGLENASIEFTRAQVKEMIDHQRDKYNWEFIYLAANQDAFEEAGSIGISGKYTANFQATSEGVKSAYSVIDNMVRVFRSKG